MASLDILELFSLYGIDSALMAAASAVITVVVDRLILSKFTLGERAEKAVKLLPYVLGILFYAIYALCCNSGIECFFENLSEVISKGLAVGTLGFLLCLAVNKIAAGKSGKLSDEDAVTALIEAYICPDELDNAVTALCAAAKGGGREKVKEVLESYAQEGVTEAEIETVTALILSYFEVTES